MQEQPKKHRRHLRVVRQLSFMIDAIGGRVANEPAMLVGDGHRHDECANYDSCLTAFCVAHAPGSGYADPQGYCPIPCSGYRPVRHLVAELSGPGRDYPEAAWWGNNGAPDEEPPPPPKHAATHQEIADAIGGSRERIRQIEAVALKKLARFGSLIRRPPKSAQD